MRSMERRDPLATYFGLPVVLAVSLSDAQWNRGGPIGLDEAGTGHAIFDHAPQEWMFGLHAS
jgi:hypothetical protein